jgi:hypothetical protein
MVPETIGKFGPDMTWKRALKSGARRCQASAADLKFLHHLPQARPGTSNR